MAQPRYPHVLSSGLDSSAPADSDRSSAAWRTGKHWLTLSSAGMLAMTSFGLLTAQPALADPAGCSRTPNEFGGQDILCPRGVQAGQTLQGTAGKDRITIVGSVVGSVDGGAGDDTITVTGSTGGNGGNGGNGKIGPNGGDAGTSASGRQGTGPSANGDEPPTENGKDAGRGGHGGTGGDAVARTGLINGGTGNDTISVTGGTGGNGGEGGNGGGGAAEQMLAYGGGNGGAGGNGGTGGAGNLGRITGGEGTNTVNVTGGTNGNGGHGGRGGGGVGTESGHGGAGGNGGGGRAASNGPAGLGNAGTIVNEGSDQITVEGGAGGRGGDGGIDGIGGIDGSGGIGGPGGNGGLGGESGAGEVVDRNGTASVRALPGRDGANGSYGFPSGGVGDNGSHNGVARTAPEHQATGRTLGTGVNATEEVTQRVSGDVLPSIPLSGVGEDASVSGEPGTTSVNAPVADQPGNGGTAAEPKSDSVGGTREAACAQRPLPLGAVIACKLAG
ncbi:hypothetical protein HUO13_23800 [Saccharopolyspora erythraea]|uniref:hypothetical protein n=1 Tax=Saccharopolyspora erythraea TaxID=1836 RepID=UPI001BAD976B|nr:hypothetical protein [Saccharopolyspora erythraea]QUH03441.1 hypothetical protein HUO13_23800 [Saccharopolyspora erythraea]